MPTVRDKKSRTGNLSPPPRIKCGASFNPLPSGKKRRRNVSASEWQKVSAPVKMELKRLRSLLEEITSAYLIKREAEVESFISAISENESAKEERFKDIRSMQRGLRNLKVKPEKGRYKDIKRVEALIASLRRIIEKW